VRNGYVVVVDYSQIVTVFLRALDYFQGILFLTTNRVGSFDEAFMSRIHVQIGYDPLDDHARNAIWENNFRKLKEDHDEGGREIQYEWDAKEYVKKSKEVRELQWNGREIRNGMLCLIASLRGNTDIYEQLFKRLWRSPCTMRRAKIHL
jgi:hypothetical protein